MDISYDETCRLLLALLIGAVIGIEREFSSKAAGFRTMILICVGSALFTMMSVELGGHGSEDRIAANILTGIGFIGAGVVFKEGLNVVGLTTAASIWITSALGIAVGAGNYRLAGEGTVITLLVLFLFEYLQVRITSIHQKTAYKITLHKNEAVQDVEQKLRDLSLRYARRSHTKGAEDFYLVVDVFGSKEKTNRFNEYLLNAAFVKAFNN